MEKNIGRINVNAIGRLREAILGGDQKACFLEREELLHRHSSETMSLPHHERYVHEFELLCDGLSCPCDDENPFAGKFVEGCWEHPFGFSRVPGGLWSNGHITHDWPRILTKGLMDFVVETSSASERLGTSQAAYFATCTRRCVDAVARFAGRFADAAKASGKILASSSLRLVPYYPAYDFFSALQSMWFWQFVTSGICGARDFALGRLDEYLFPYYVNDLHDNLLTKDEAIELLAMFFLKTNELAGTGTDDYQSKPTPCQATKQYVTLRGDKFNVVTGMIVEAQRLCGLTQPTLNFRMSKGDSDASWNLVGRAAAMPTIPNIFNSDVITSALVRAGIPSEVADGFDFTACNRVNLPQQLYNRMDRIDHFNDCVRWMMEGLHSLEAPSSMDDVIAAIGKVAENKMREFAVATSRTFTDALSFSLDSLAVTRCVAACKDISQGGADMYRWQHHIFVGIATMGDSLTAIDQLVFREKRFPYKEFLAIVEADFDGHEALRQEILTKVPKYGNDDDEADRWAVAVATCLLDAMEEVGRQEGYIMVASLYSLSQHHRFGRGLGATPDGRKAGMPLSENMSPTYGRDRRGVTAVMKSVAKLPLARTVCGGLNIKFSQRLRPEELKNLARGFFAQGGLHVGFTLVTREELEDARVNPEKYRTLMVRKFGFSEYYVALSPEYQQEIIDRT